jgi:hypothetical protein
MKRAQCTRSESMKINRWMRTFAGCRQTVKLLLRIAAAGI